MTINLISYGKLNPTPFQPPTIHPLSPLSSSPSLPWRSSGSDHPYRSFLHLFLLLLLPISSFSFSPEPPTDRRVLVLLDNLSLKSSHSLFFTSLQSRGFFLDFKLTDDPSLALQRYGEFLYDALILFSPSADLTFGGKVYVLDFVDSGHDLIFVADSFASDFIKSIATECGVDFDERVVYRQAEDGVRLPRSIHLADPLKSYIDNLS
ncbi:Dolichyl-diphosphooligosaccharide--protein glycosyltransferase 48 kDa subunit [Turnera subulata]|uniref:Dolichyl-diphosphooligosaccharide--protein glycosyltransferase 48 kDa subunit n=1 Tax=Turnera subulata TaxID=218843 RepID=A0A9Q0GG18_9ROSI|nr:Dolichyl-diphosphooligosaccharide--protein glycosyltransferase 48 kDa subunit [Turnera subulata]